MNTTPINKALARLGQFEAEIERTKRLAPELQSQLKQVLQGRNLEDLEPIKAREASDLNLKIGLLPGTLARLTRDADAIRTALKQEYSNLRAKFHAEIVAQIESGFDQAAKALAPWFDTAQAAREWLGAASPKHDGATVRLVDGGKLFVVEGARFASIGSVRRLADLLNQIEQRDPIRDRWPIAQSMNRLIGLYEEWEKGQPVKA